MINLLIPVILTVFVIGTVITLLVSRTASLLKIPVYISSIIFILTIPMIARLIETGPYTIYNGNLLFDALSVYHIVLVNFVFLITSIYSIGYFKEQIKCKGDFQLSFIRRYTALWDIFHLFLLIILMSNNIGLMWVALEATTLVSAFLIVSPSNPLSAEAMWKYLIICSVGIAFGFIGTILTVAAANNSVTDPLFLFSDLVKHAALINPKIMLLAFIFIVVGFGTKTGLSPMHTWLPDAHSQSPTPVSAVFSGVMLNCAFFGIMRYMSITKLAMGNASGVHSIILFFGFTSLVFAVIFIPIQFDIKRLLAYCSIEHMGIIAVGLGMGGMGTFAALFHITNHSLSKVLAFFSAGHISEHYGTRDMRKIRAAAFKMPLWGTLFFVSMLVLMGAAPFSVFLSELLLFKEGIFTGRYIVVIVLMLSLFVIFISLLKNAAGVSFGTTIREQSEGNVRSIDKIIAFFSLALLFTLGIWMPAPFSHFLKDAAAIVENGVKL